MKFPRRAILLNLLLACGSLIFAAAIAETVLRVAPPPSLDKRKILSEVGRMIPPYLMLPDPEIGWVLAPSFTGMGHGPGWSVTFSTDALGLRDREYDPDDRAERVVVVGDSYTFGFGVEAEETFPKVAERDLMKTSLAGLEVVNAGVSGYGPLEEAAFLKRVAPRFKPRAVVMAFFEGNDVRNAIEYPLRFTMGPEGYLHREGWDPFVTPISYLATYLAMKGRNVMEKLETRHGIELSHSAILDARSYSESIGARFLLLLIPDIRSERAARPWILRIYDRLLGSGGDINAGMESFARSEGVDVINLSPIFDNAPDAPPLRFKWDGHFTRDGHRIAGEALANWLVSRMKPYEIGASSH
jgi:lysophospholipase L1-like esterase